jgi:transcriptional regulator with XRE-family HTH domain
MTRRPLDPQAGPATETLTLRLSSPDRALLDRLVSLRAAELAPEGIEVTAASYVRGLIRRDAQARGLSDEPAAGKGKGPRGGAKPKTPADDEPAAERVRADLVRALKAGGKQGEIADSAGIDRGQVSRFKAGKSGLSPEALRKLAAAVRASY